MIFFFLAVKKNMNLNRENLTKHVLAISPWQMTNVHQTNQKLQQANRPQLTVKSSSKKRKGRGEGGAWNNFGKRHIEMKRNVDKERWWQWNGRWGKPLAVIMEQNIDGQCNAMQCIEFLWCGSISNLCCDCLLFQQLPSSKVQASMLKVPTK